MKYQSCDFHRYFISKKFLGNIDNEFFLDYFFVGGGTFLSATFAKHPNYLIYMYGMLKPEIRSEGLVKVQFYKSKSQKSLETKREQK